MSDGYEIVRTAVERLRTGARNEHGVDTLPIGPAGDPWSARLARGAFGELQLMVALPDGRERFAVRTGSVLRSEWTRIREKTPHPQGQIVLLLTCSDARLHPTLTSLVGEMVDRAQRSGRPCIDEFIDALESWRVLLAREQSRLSRNALLGLFGELVVLERLARKDPMAALAAWRGPDQAPHDFQRRNALEVKTLSGTGAPVVGIHGLTQLDPPQGGELHLLALRIEESDEGLRVGDLIEQVARLGVPQQTLIARAGAIDAADDARRLVVMESRLFLVGDDFPGIRASRLAPERARGIDDLSYTLQLDACPGELSADVLDRVLEEL